MSIKNVGKGLRRWAAVWGLVFGVLCLVGCRTHTHEQQLAEPPRGGDTTTAGAAVTNSSLLQPEVLRIGDSLTVSFTDTPTPIPAFQEKIKEDGTITLLLNQTFKADGKSRGELEKEIRACYVPDYFKNLTVTVTPDVSTRWYYVDGEVKAPNRQIYNNRITVLKAIASVGGFTDFAKKKKVRVARVDGRVQTVNCVKALDNPSLDLEIYPGDKIHVPRRFW
jgi:protein involved in polysaccharide export with SLBB domain